MATYVAYDLETTGLDVLSDRAVEVAAVLVEDGKIIDYYSSLINSGKPCSPVATAIHGLDENKLNKAPSSMVVFSELIRFIDGHYLVAHNGNNFDHYLLRIEILRHSLPMPQCKLIDSLLIASSMFPGSYKLENLCGRYNIKNESAHRALSDTKALAELVEHLCDHNVDLIKCHKLSKSFELEQFFPNIIGFQLLLKGLAKQKRIEISYQKENQDPEKRWILPVRGDKKFNAPLQLVSLCCRDNSQKHFRLDRVKEVHSVEE